MTKFSTRDRNIVTFKHESNKWNNPVTFQTIRPLHKYSTKDLFSCALRIYFAKAHYFDPCLHTCVCGSLSLLMCCMFSVTCYSLNSRDFITRKRSCRNCKDAKYLQASFIGRFFYLISFGL